jgi:hypothetical protein
MITTTSRIKSSMSNTDIVNHSIIQKACKDVAENGGSFSIDTVWGSIEEGCWFTVYTINWPDTMKVESENIL